MKICVVGTGYVGLVTGTCFAEKGHEVRCMDIDAVRVEKLKKGECPIYEPGLGEMLRRNAAAGRLSFTTEMGEALEGAALCFIAVGTPPAGDGSADLAQVLSAADDIAEHIGPDCRVVVKSTVPVGTGTLLCKRIKSHMNERGLGAREVEIISNPEFLKEGAAIHDCLHPDRVVVGAQSEAAKALMRELYRDFAPEEKIFIMDPASAEITKYAANTMLAARISFMNEIAQLCDKVGADVLAVKEGMASDSRIGPSFLNAGCGYGGSCFPKDVRALCCIGESQGLDMTLASAVAKVNRKQKEQLHMMLRRRFGADMEGVTAAVMGLAFKPGTDDMREAPSLTLIRGLINAGASVRAYDPIAEERARAMLPTSVEFAGGMHKLLEGADCAVIVTEWPEFRAFDWEAARASMRRKIVFDGRNICDPHTMKALGFEYYCIGRNMLPER